MAIYFSQVVMIAQLRYVFVLSSPRLIDDKLSANKPFAATAQGNV